MRISATLEDYHGPNERSLWVVELDDGQDVEGFDVLAMYEDQAIIEVVWKHGYRFATTVGNAREQ